MSWGRGKGGWSREGYEPRRLATRDLHVTIQGFHEIIPGGFIRNRQKTAYDAGTGVWLGIDTDANPKFGVGDTTNYLKWDPTNGLVVAGDGGGLTSIDGGNIQTGTVTADAISAGAITAAEIAANTITASEIAAGTITSTEIASNTIVAGNIAASTITATELNVSTLSAIAADLGTITAGTINMYTGTWDTDATGFRLNASEIAGQNAGTDQVIISSSDGKLTAGAGAVILDAEGIAISAGTADQNKLKFKDGSNQLLTLYAEEDPGNSIQTTLNCLGTATATDALISMTAQYSTRVATIEFDSTPEIRFSTGAGSQVTLDSSGTLLLPEYLSHAGDTNTYLRFQPDQIDLVAGGSTLVTVQEVAAIPQLGFFGVAPVARSGAYTWTNGTTDRVIDANATTLAELADVVYTMWSDLKDLGLFQ